MTVKLLTERNLVFLSLIGGCTGSSESFHVKMPYCWKSHVAAHQSVIDQQMKPGFSSGAEILLSLTFIASVEWNF